MVVTACDRHPLYRYRWSTGRGGFGYANGAGLIVFGFAVPIPGLHLLGGEDIAQGQLVTKAHPEKLSAIGSATDPTPFLTLFTGMLFANLSYWGTNQYVIHTQPGCREPCRWAKRCAAGGVFQAFDPVLCHVTRHHCLSSLRPRHRRNGQSLSAVSARCPAQLPHWAVFGGAVRNGIQFV